MKIRLRGLAALTLLTAGGAALLPATAATAAPTDCVVTGYTAPDTATAATLRSQLSGGSAADGGGVILNGQKAWQVKPGSQVIVVVTAADPKAAPTIVEFVGGTAIATTEAGEDANGRVVSAPLKVEPGAATATVGIRTGGDCASEDLVVRAKVTPLLTILGGAGIAVTLVFGFLLVFLARRRPGGWLRRAATAVVPGLLAGVGEAATLYDTGVVAPFAPTWWALAGVGVLLALLLPLTRFGRRRVVAPAAGGLPGPLPDLGRYLPQSLFTQTAAGTVYRGFDPATGQPVLIKVAHPESLPAPGYGAPDGAPATPVQAPPATPVQAPPAVPVQAPPAVPVQAPPAGTVTLPLAGPGTVVPPTIPIQGGPVPLAPSHFVLPAAQPAAGSAETVPINGSAPVAPAPVDDRFPSADPLPPVALAGAVPASEQTARLDTSGNPLPPAEPARLPTQPVEYLVPGLDATAAPTAAPTPAASQLTVTQQRFLRDADVMRRITNPWCLRVRDAFGPVVVTDFVDGMPLRQVLVEKGRLTGAQSMVVVAGALRGLAAVHELGLVHRDVTPANIYLDQSGRSILADFELTAPGDEAVPPSGSATYLSPEQRAGAPLDARSDLFSTGLVLAELLTGEVPVVAPELPAPASWRALHPAIAGLLGWTLNPDPAARPATALGLLTELERAASTAFGADWLTLGAVTGAILVPAAVVAVASAGVAGAGAAVTGAGAIAGGTAQTGLNVLVNVGGQTSAAAGRGVLSFAAPVAAAVVAVTVAVVAAVAAPKPKPVAEDVLTVPVATVILNRTFGEAQQKIGEHVGPPAIAVLDGLFAVDGSTSGTLTNIRIRIPQGQKGYPALFDAIAEEKLPDGRTAYLYLHFERAAADLAWQLAGSYYSLDASAAPTLDFQPLVVDAATLPDRYLQWFTHAVSDHSLSSDTVLDVSATSGSFISSATGWANLVRNTHFYEGLKPLEVSKPGTVVYLADGTARTTFTLTVQDDLYNEPGTYSGPCDGYQVYYTQDGKSDLPAGYFRELHVKTIVTVQATIPTQKNTELNGKVLIDDSALSYADPQQTPC